MNINKTISTKNWKWIIIGLSLAVLAVAGCTSTTAKTASNQVYRVGIISGVDTFNATIDGFKAKMAELGYVEDENIIYDLQAASGDSEKMKQIAEKFTADEVDLIFTTTTGAVKAAKTATAGTDIPVVFTIVLNPLASGVVDDLGQPGGNVTGVSRPAGDFMGKRIEYLHQISPDVERIWIPFNPEYSTTAVSLESLHQVADSLEIKLIEVPVGSSEDVPAELSKYAETDDPGFDAILIMPDPAIQNATSWDAILAFANEHHLPIVGNVPGQVNKGALFTYSDDNLETGQLAAPLADKILRGVEPAKIPVAFAEPHLYINYKVAQALDLTIEEALLAQAVEITR